MAGNILIYTRKPKDEYTESLSGSIHLAYRRPSGQFEPLNQNYGILFPEATISEQNTIREKGLKSPFIFRAKDGLFGIIAVRTAQMGADDEESRGRVLLWTSSDLIEFDCLGLIRLHDSLFVESAICEYSEIRGAYEIIWKDSQGNAYSNHINDLTKDGASSPRRVETYPFTPPPVDLPDINPGNILQAEPATARAAYEYWTPPYHIKTLAPDIVTISSPEEFETVKAAAVYSDGSVAEKRIKGDLSGVNFSSPGTYEIKGKAVTPAYKFPLARGYADPVILPWNGKYYFIATNDNKNDIGLYVRKSDTIDGLFAPEHKEFIILDIDEEKDLIQTFWAPEFHNIGGDLYILFAVGGKKWGPQCHIMKLKKGGEIIKQEDWEPPVRVRKKDGSFLAEDGITLDMTYFKADGKSYAAWSYRSGIGTPFDTGSMLYIAETDEKDPSILASEPVLLTRPLFGWENIQGTINNEGPYPLITDDAVYIAYSGGAARGYTYSIGIMSIPRGSNYLDAAKWKKAVTPVVNYLSIDGVYGAGHNSFFTDDEGNVMIAYHAEEKIVGHGMACSAIHRVHFRSNGAPVFNMCAKRDLNEELSEVCIKIKIKSRK